MDKIQEKIQILEARANRAERDALFSAQEAKRANEARKEAERKLRDCEIAKDAAYKATAFPESYALVTDLDGRSFLLRRRGNFYESFMLGSPIVNQAHEAIQTLIADANMRLAHRGLQR